ncbi:hypothetical protein CTI12_AA333270 [Artemisia annua]|uniref:Uncharacterized protein n=1 Tax=Artemisia annua TaxID=35608 RepID=A0A2U1MWU7_ARTAN|nr:hypothetical protein CTI12_AA333270 [Artemisia annua]
MGGGGGIIRDALRQAFMQRHEYDSLREDDKAFSKLQRPILLSLLVLITLAILISTIVSLNIMFPSDPATRPLCKDNGRIQPLSISFNLTVEEEDSNRGRGGAFYLTDQETVDYYWMVVFLPSVVVFAVSAVYLVAGYGYSTLVKLDFDVKQFTLSISLRFAIAFAFDNYGYSTLVKLDFDVKQYILRTPAKLDFDVKQLTFNFRRFENFMFGVNNWIHADHEFRRVAVSCTAPARHGCLMVVENNYCASKRGGVRCLSILNLVFAIIFGLLALFLGSTLLTLGSGCSIPLFWCYEIASWGLVILYGGTAFHLRRKAATILDESDFAGRNLGLEMLETEFTPDVERRQGLRRNIAGKEGDIEEDAFEALFKQLEEDLKNDGLTFDDDDDEISEEDLIKLERELEEALADDELQALFDDTTDEIIEMEVKDKKVVNKKGTTVNQNAMISNIVHVTKIPRKKVLKWFEDKRGEDGVPDQRQPYQSGECKTVLVLAFYIRHNAMISNIVHVTKIPRKKVLKWFEDKRGEDGVPDQRQPYQRNTETLQESKNSHGDTAEVEKLI